MRLDTKEKRLAWRFIPENATIIDDGHCIAYEYETKQGKLAAVGYCGTAGKPDFHYTFRTPEQRRKHIDEWRLRIADHIDRMNERKLARKAFVNPLKVGDILYSSWGYEQTNIDYYQVVESKGNFVIVRQVRADREDTGWLQGTCTPRKDDFCIGANYKPLRRIVLSYGCGPYINITNYASASLWDGKPNYWTAYA
jgi:hypothetical protein